MREHKRTHKKLMCEHKRMDEKRCANTKVTKLCTDYKEWICSKNERVAKRNRDDVERQALDEAKADLQALLDREHEEWLKQQARAVDKMSLQQKQRDNAHIVHQEEAPVVQLEQ